MLVIKWFYIKEDRNVFCHFSISSWSLYLWTWKSNPTYIELGFFSSFIFFFFPQQNHREKNYVWGNTFFIFPREALFRSVYWIYVIDMGYAQNPSNYLIEASWHKGYVWDRALMSFTSLDWVTNNYLHARI